MNHCEVCKNEYNDLFEIRFIGDGKSHWFDCFECATHKLAPTCSQCGVKILGHGVEAHDELFCGAHCARAQGHKDIVDHSKRMLA